MLSLYPQEHTSSNFCHHMPYRTLVAPTLSDSASFKSFTMGGTVQQPPTPQQEDMEVDPLSSSNTWTQQQQLQQQQQQDAPPSPRTSPRVVTLSAPADYQNMDPNMVAEALEIARDSAEGARDPIVSGILESALSQVWDRVMGSPDAYVMTPGEFAVFNFYQHRFVGNKTAVAARARFWDNTHA